MDQNEREFLKGGANVHVKQHYRMHNGKLVYVQAHDKAIQTGTEAQLHERVQFGKNKAHLLAVDPEDRDAIAKHASALGIKHDISYQGGKIRDHEGNVEKHGFYYHKFASEEDAKKVHAMLHPQADAQGGSGEQQAEPEKKPESTKEEAQHESGPYPSGWDDNPSYHLKYAMMQAAASFHDDPKMAIESLKQAAALAEKHGINYTHANGMKVDADWMEKKAAEMEAALPKDEPAPAVDPEYTKSAKEALGRSSVAHVLTQHAQGEQSAGKFAPENAAYAMDAHKASHDSHLAAAKAHEAAADKAPTPELQKHHMTQSDKHLSHAKVHGEEAKKHEAQHQANTALKNYKDEQAKADDVATAASGHSQKAKLSESAEDHETAAKAHEAAAQAHTGMIQHALGLPSDAEGHANAHAGMATQHQKKADYHKAAAEAWKASKDAASTTGGVSLGAHHAAKVAHHKAWEKAEGLGDTSASSTHAKKYSEHEEATVVKSKPQEEVQKPAEPSKPDFSKYDHAPMAQKGLDAYKSGDWAEAAKNLKQAAVIAMHKGNKEEANGYAAKAKAAMLKLNPVQKAIVAEAVDKNIARIRVMEAARAVHQEKIRVRNLLKSVDTMPSFGRLQQACAKATRAGITDLDTIVAHALGGKQQAAPYLKFIAVIQ